MREIATAGTVFALSSAPGRAGIAVVRISGPGAGRALAALGGRVGRPRRALRARLADPGTGAALDDALTLWFPGPASATGEDVAELHLHGGPAVVTAVLGALGRLDGLAPAGPGEFTRRAFHNGKLDLTEIEGLADLIAAETEIQRVQALRQLEGGLGALYDGWRTELVRCLGHVEAGVDFTDEEVPDDIVMRSRGEIEVLRCKIAAHLDDGRRGERLRGGFAVVIAGPPNAGKSSLLNALARRDAAIVTDEPGTTRDVIDVALDLDGYPVLVSDTAGLRARAGAIEAEGIRRAEERMAGADLVLWLRDASRADPPPGPAGLAAPVLEVWSKSDLGAAPDGGMAVSVVTGAGLARLVGAISEKAAAGLAPSESPLLTRNRHRQALETAQAALARALAAGPAEVEIVAEELRAAAHALGRVTGRVDVEDVLGAIFAEFCIGK
jgi:tRNA modification GTPase